MDYVKLTTEQLIEQFKSRIDNTGSFGLIENSKIYETFMEFLSECCDDINFYTQRIAEESDITTAKIKSTMIKHCHNRGYHPRRPIPAQAELIIRLKGPFPEELSQPGTEIFFNQSLTDLTYNGFKFKLDSSYSYVLTQEDIDYCHESDWEKQLIAAVPHNNSIYLPLQGVNYINDNNTVPIKCFQGELKTYTITGASVLNKLGKHRQTYKIPDKSFSNWYGSRDPYAYRGVRNFVQKNSWCKVGIGKTITDAFNDELLFDIETQSIKLNKNYQKLNKKNYGSNTQLFDVITRSNYLDLEYDSSAPKTALDKTLRICTITSNPDETIKITFGNDSTVVNGLSTADENLYIQYISTSGKDANQQGITGKVITHNNAIYASVNGNIIDITSNIEFVLNSDIYGGDNFETIESMRINAPAYFSSQNKLIMKTDYENYFKTLTSPMLVNCAYVQGQQEVENNNKSELPFTQNIICYTLLGRLYIQNSGDFYPRNILTGTDNLSEPFSLYNDSYLTHLCDRIKFMCSPLGYKQQQYKKSPSEQWIKNVQLIRENCKDNILFNTTLLSMPPMIHYFDLVGQVNVKPTTNIQEYNNRLKNKVYKFLDIQSKITPNIYKSDIIKIYADDPDTLNVDIDIKLSSIIQSAESSFTWNIDNRKNSLILDETLPSWTIMNSNNTTGLVKDRSFNIIKLLPEDNNGKKLSEMLVNKSRMHIIITNNDNKNFTDTYLNCTSVTGVDQNDGKEYIYITLPCVEELLGTDLSENIIINIKLKTELDFSSTSQFSDYRINDYKLAEENNSDIFKNISDDLTNWLTSYIYSYSANKPIKLPYIVPIKDNEYYARQETIMRKTSTNGLNEHNFWTEFAPKIIKKYYPKIKNDTLMDDEYWIGASLLLYDIYSLVKPALTDAILDDNNNIVNFSMYGCEAAVLINKVNIVQN